MRTKEGETARNGCNVMRGFNCWQTRGKKGSQRTTLKSFAHLAMEAARGRRKREEEGRGGTDVWVVPDSEREREKGRRGPNGPEGKKERKRKERGPGWKKKKWARGKRI